MMNDKSFNYEKYIGKYEYKEKLINKPKEAYYEIQVTSDVNDGDEYTEIVKSSTLDDIALLIKYCSGNFGVRNFIRNEDKYDEDLYAYIYDIICSYVSSMNMALLTQ